ncbi:MAG: metal ABC transporter substrate-binding protein [Acidimicrobiaceae bacterium]
MKIKTVLALSIFIASCSGNDQGSSPQSVGCSLGDVVRDRSIKIATTVAPITSIVANIAGGSSAIITGIVPEGTNSHTFEPRPSDAATLESADIVFINGLVLEEPTKDLALANIREGSNVCELGTEILPESEYIFDFSFPKEGGKPNPHLWTNPPMAKKYAQVIRDVLVRRDPSNASIYERNFSAFALKIDSLDEATKTATATIPEDQRKLLTYHDAYAYFATNYGFTVVGAIQPSSFDEPTPKDIAELISQVKSQKVKAIFGSEVFPSTVLEQIGAETGVRYVDVLRDDDLLGEPGGKEHSWLGLMRFNFVTIVEALGGDASALKSLDVRDVVKDEAKYPQ